MKEPSQLKKYFCNALHFFSPKAGLVLHPPLLEGIKTGPKRAQLRSSEKGCWD